jgi:hypothetical protein
MHDHIVKSHNNDSNNNVDNNNNNNNVGLVRQDDKRPDGLTLIPWQGGKPLTWDVTVVSTLATSYVQSASRGAGPVAELEADRKSVKYTELLSNYIFQPFAVENLGPTKSSAIDFLNDLGGRLVGCSGETREASFLFQRISVAVQRFNSVLLHDTFPKTSNRTNTHSDILFLNFCFNPRELHYRGYKK